LNENFVSVISNVAVWNKLICWWQRLNISNSKR